MSEDLLGRARGQSGVAHAVALDVPSRRARIEAAHYSRALLAVLLGALTGALLATDIRGPAKLVVVTAMFTTVWVLALWGAGTIRHARGPEMLLATALRTLAGLAALAMLNALLLDSVIEAGTLAFMAAGVFVVAVAFQAATSRVLAPRRRVVFVGNDEAGKHLMRELELTSEFECVGVIADRVNGPGHPGIPFLGRSAQLLDVVSSRRPELIVCRDRRTRTRTVGRLLDAGVTSVRVLDRLEFSELAFRRVPGRPISPSWFAGVLDIEAKHHSARAKRAFDAAFAASALVLTLPLFLVIAVLVRLSGPVLYRQVRSGEGGKPFQMLKFRTMVPDAENGTAVWAAVNDPRATRVGRFLRRTRLDELPQFWNVLRGEMSIVGPRPERPEYVELLQREIPFWTRRHLLKPGITGWAQVHMAYAADIDSATSKLSYDLYYLKHRCFTLDLVILLKTVKVLFAGTGR